MKTCSWALTALTVLAGCQTPPAGPPPRQDLVLKTIPVSAAPHGNDTAGGFVYIGSTMAHTINVIDTKTDTLVKQLPRPGGEVVFVVPFPDGKHIAALDNDTGEVLIIDPAQDHKILQAIAVGKGPDEAYFAADGSLMVALADEDKIARLTFGADRSVPPEKMDFAVGTAAGATNRHRPLGYQTGWAIVPNTGDNDATLVDTLSGTVRHMLDGNNPGPVAIGTVGGAAKVAMVGYRGSHSVVFYDLPNGEPVKITGQGLFPQAITLDLASNRAFAVMSGSDELTAYDYVAKTAIGRVKVGSRPVEAHVWPGLVDATRREVWVGNDGGASVSVVDAATLSLKVTIAAGKGHHHLTTANGKAYVSNLDDGTVTVIDRSLIP